jgi:hypothetical protein
VKTGERDQPELKRGSWRRAIVRPDDLSRGEEMGCLLVLLGAFAPRVLFLIIWIARPAYIDAVFDTFILPALGLVFLPFTTLLWVLLDAPPGGVVGFDWFWIGLAVLMDLSHYVSTYAQRGSMTRSAGTA